jgi:O-antigen/teichoic acid export membrane protein
MSLRQKSVLAAIWSFIEIWGNQVFSSIVFFLLARLLGPENFGLIALALVFITFAQAFVDQGFSEAIIQRQEIEEEHLHTAFWSSLLLGTIFTAATVAFSGNIAAIFREPKLAPLIKWLSINFVLTAFSSVQIGMLRREFAYKALATRSLIAIILSGSLSIVAALQGYGVWSLVIQQLSNKIIQTVVIWMHTKWTPKFIFSVRHFKEMFSFGINVVALRVLSFFSRRSDDLLIGYFLGSTALGYYTVAYRIIFILTELLTGVISRVTLSTFSRLQDNLEQLRKVFYKTTQMTSLIAFPVFIGLFIMAPQVGTIVFGKGWDLSITVMQILVFVGILHSVLYFNLEVMKALDNTSQMLVLNTVTTTFNVLGFWIAMRWGIAAIALSYVISSYLTFPLYVFAIRKMTHLDLKKYAKQYIYPVIGSLAMVLGIVALSNFTTATFSLYLSTALLIIVGAILYISTISLLSPALVKELVGIVGSLRTKMGGNG